MLALLFLPEALFAGAWHHSSSLTLGLEYDSNPRLRSEGAEGSWSAAVLPAYALMWLDERDTVQAEVAGRFERSSSNQVSDRNDPVVKLAWQRRNPRGMFGLSGTYEQAATREVELEESGSNTDGTRGSSVLGLNWQHALTERLLFDASANYRMVEYKRTNLVDYSEQGGAMTLTRILSPHKKAFLRLSAANYEPKHIGDSAQSYVGVVGVSYSLSERFTWMAEGGATLRKQHEDQTGWQGNSSVSYRYERLSLSLQGGREITASGTGGFVEADQLRGTLGYLLDEKTSLSMDASWRKVDGDSSSTLYRVGTAVSRQISLSWKTRLSYEYRHYEASREGNAAGNIVMLTLKYNYSTF